MMPLHRRQQEIITWQNRTMMLIVTWYDALRSPMFRIQAMHWWLKEISCGQTVTHRIICLRPFGSRTNTGSHGASSIRIHHRASLMRIYPFKASRTSFFWLLLKKLIEPILFAILQFKAFLPNQKLWYPLPHDAVLAWPNQVCSTIARGSWQKSNGWRRAACCRTCARVHLLNFFIWNHGCHNWCFGFRKCIDGSWWLL